MHDYLKSWRLLLVYRLFPESLGLLEGNHQERTAYVGHFRITLTTYDESKPTTYSRESVYQMLRTVRENEKRMGWKCPEPKL